MIFSKKLILSYSEPWLGRFKNTFVANMGKFLTTIESTSEDGSSFSRIAHWLQGKIRFDACGDVEPSSVTMGIVRNRKFVVLE